MNTQGVERSACSRFGLGARFAAVETMNVASAPGASVGHMVGRTVGAIGGAGWKAVNSLANKFRSKEHQVETKSIREYSLKTVKPFQFLGGLITGIASLPVVAYTAFIGGMVGLGVAEDDMAGSRFLLGDIVKGRVTALGDIGRRIINPSRLHLNPGSHLSAEDQHETMIADDMMDKLEGLDTRFPESRSGLNTVDGFWSDIDDQVSQLVEYASENTTDSVDEMAVQEARAQLENLHNKQESYNNRIRAFGRYAFNLGGDKGDATAYETASKKQTWSAAEKSLKSLQRQYGLYMAQIGNAQNELQLALDKLCRKLKNLPSVYRGPVQVLDRQLRAAGAGTDKLYKKCAASIGSEDGVSVKYLFPGREITGATKSEQCEDIVNRLLISDKSMGISLPEEDDALMPTDIEWPTSFIMRPRG